MNDLSLKEIELAAAGLIRHPQEGYDLNFATVGDALIQLCRQLEKTQTRQRRLAEELELLQSQLREQRS